MGVAVKFSILTVFPVSLTNNNALFLEAGVPFKKAMHIWTMDQTHAIALP